MLVPWGVGEVAGKVIIWGRKRKNVFFIAYSLQGKIKIQDVGQKQKVYPKMVKFAKLEGSISDPWSQSVMTVMPPTKTEIAPKLSAK